MLDYPLFNWGPSAIICVTNPQHHGGPGHVLAVDPNDDTVVAVALNDGCYGDLYNNRVFDVGPVNQPDHVVRDNVTNDKDIK